MQDAALSRWIIDSATDFAIIATDRDARITTWNEGAHRLLGWSEEEMLGQEVDRIFTPEDRAGGRPQIEMEMALATGAGNDDRWHLRKDGERFWANGQLTVLRDDAGAAVGFVKVLRDRTEQKLATETLRGSQTNIRLLLDSMMEGFYAVDHDGVAILCNAAFLRMLGFEREEDVVGRTLHGQIHHSHPDGTPYDVRDCPIYACARDGIATHRRGIALELNHLMLKARSARSSTYRASAWRIRRARRWSGSCASSTPIWNARCCRARSIAG